MNTMVDEVRKNAAGATHAVENAASGAKTSFVDALGKVAHAYGVVRSAGVDDYLAAVGLSRKTSSLGSFVRFSSGFALGAATGLLFAPMAGRDLRKKIARSIGVLFSPVLDKPVDKVSDETEQAATKTSDVVHDATVAAKNEDCIRSDNGDVSDSSKRAKDGISRAPKN